MRTLRLLLLVGLLLLGQTLGAGAFERGVAATVERQFALIDMGDVINHFVEEVAVVGNQQQGARIAFQPLFEPDDCVEVQVVGRFVEQQQIRGAHQCLCQIQTHPPATGEIADLTIHLLIGETKTGEQLARPRIGGVTVGAVEFCVQARQRGAVVGLFGGGKLALHLTQTQVAIKHIIDRQAPEGVDLLAHMRDAPVSRQQAIARIRMQLAAQQGEQAGFAGTVGADEAGFVAGVQGQLGVF